MASFEDIADELSTNDVSFTTARSGAQVAGWVDSGNYALNWAISNRFNGGYPLGHVVEIFGPEASGKSLLTARAIAEFQRQNKNGLAFLDDTENAFNPKWAERSLGVDVDRLNLTSSATVEHHFKVLVNILEKVRSENPPPKTIVALDSLALLSDDHEMESDFSVSRVGGRAKQIRKLFRRVRPMIRGLPVLHIVTNHETANIGSWGSSTTTPGGSGTRYQASVRISLKNPKHLKKGKDIKGVLVRAYIEKNRITSPYKEATIVIPFEASISKFSGLIPVLLDLDILDTSGRTLVYKGEDTGIYTQKTNPVKQDKSAKELVKKYPDILDFADSILEDREQRTSINDIFDDDEDDNEEE